MLNIAGLDKTGTNIVFFMENSSRRILDEIMPLISSIKAQMSLLEDKLAELQSAAGTEENILPEAAGDSLSGPVREQDDMPDFTEEKPETAPAEEGLAAAAEPEAENLFSEDEMDLEYAAGPVMLDVNDLMHEAEHLSVMDALADREAWRRDRPGLPVRDIRSAISLNDRALFIRTLFREDPVLFSTTMESLNAAGTLQEAVQLLRERFPEWNMESDAVYRFMMCVRRKVG